MPHHQPIRGAGPHAAAGPPETPAGRRSGRQDPARGTHAPTTPTNRAANVHAAPPAEARCRRPRPRTTTGPTRRRGHVAGVRTVIRTSAPTRPGKCVASRTRGAALTIGHGLPKDRRNALTSDPNRAAAASIRTTPTSGPSPPNAANAAAAMSAAAPAMSPTRPTSLPTSRAAGVRTGPATPIRPITRSRRFATAGSRRAASRATSAARSRVQIDALGRARHAGRRPKLGTPSRAIGPAGSPAAARTPASRWPS